MLLIILICAAGLLALLDLLGVTSRVKLLSLAVVLVCVAMLLGRVV